MKLRKLSKIIGFCIVVIALFYFISKKENVIENEIDQAKIEDFDIILSKGQSVQSKLISFLELSAEDYSHIGILIKENTKVFVFHSTPDGTQLNGIRYDDFQTFINLSNVSDFIVLRNKNISFEFGQKLRSEFDRFKTIQAPFDYDFNNMENTKIYCSELAWLIFKNAGLFEASDFNIAKPIYPESLVSIKN